MEFHWYQLMIPLAAGGLGYYARHLIERRRELQNKVNERRREVYQKFVNLVIDDLVEVGKEPPEVPQNLSHNKMFDFLKEYMLYASPDVVNAFGDYRQYIFKEVYGKEKIDTRMQYQKLSKVIMEMREDLGLSNKDIGTFGERTFKAVLIDYYHYFKS